MRYAKLWVTKPGNSAAYCDSRKHYWEKNVTGSHKFTQNPAITMFFFGKSDDNLCMLNGLDNPHGDVDDWPCQSIEEAMGYAKVWATEVGKSAAYCERRKHYWEKFLIDSTKFGNNQHVTMFYYG